MSCPDLWVENLLALATEEVISRVMVLAPGGTELAKVSKKIYLLIIE